MQKIQYNRKKLISHYSISDEHTRLHDSRGQLEFLRSLAILRRCLPPAPAIIYDIGGGTGPYAFRLTAKGYAVHLIDPVPGHIETAERLIKRGEAPPLASLAVGDARHPELPAGAADAVLLMGPLYHLQEKSERMQALRKSRELLKPKGTLAAVGISRFASLIDGLHSGYFRDPVFRDIIRGDLENGMHRNPTANPAYFTDTFFHHPEELRDEILEAGFRDVELSTIEGLGYLMQDFAARWQNTEYRDFLLEVIEKTDKEPALIGASPHIMCTGVKGSAS